MGRKTKYHVKLADEIAALDAEILRFEVALEERRTMRARLRQLLESFREENPPKEILVHKPIKKP